MAMLRVRVGGWGCVIEASSMSGVMISGVGVLSVDRSVRRDQDCEPRIKREIEAQRGSGEAGIMVGRM